MAARFTLHRTARLVFGIGFALSATLLVPLTTEAAGRNAPQIAQPRVMVPHVPAPVPGHNRKRGIAGCWSAQKLIYGPYAFSFCSNGSYGSYQVSGGALACSGTVNVARGGGAFTVQLSRSRCNGWTDWSADTLVCRSHGGSWAGGQWSGGYRNGGGHGGGHSASYSSGAKEVAAPNVATPHVPAPRVRTPRFRVPSHRLDCTYYPAVAGYHPVGLTMSPN